MVFDDESCLHASCDSNGPSGESLCVSSDTLNIANEPGKAFDDIEDGIFVMEDLGQPKEENQGGDLKKELIAQPPVQRVELVKSLSVHQVSMVDIIPSDKTGDDNASVDQYKKLDIDEKLGVKRPRAECNYKDSSVRVVYSSLPSRSKRKLEELLHHWSEWHANNCASEKHPADSLESGEETYFPALHVGSDKSSTVSFSMDVHVLKRQRLESSSLNNECSPLYDRGYAIGLASDAGASDERGIDLREAPRCFNCNSYNHPLSECSKPRDNAAVNSARKQFQSKKNQSTGPRVPTRYYQESPGGKFDGLKPGALSAETRKVLGVGELDPPPWLNRMRELGYPPGYLDLEEEDQPSGIQIHGDEETQTVNVSNGPLLDVHKSQKKMTIDFPGINAPIPENADRNLWAAPRGPPDADFHQNQSNSRWNYAQDSMTNGNFHGAYRPRNHFDGPSPYGLGASPPMPHYPHDYYSSEPFNHRGVPFSGSRFGRPVLHYDYGSF